MSSCEGLLIRECVLLLWTASSSGHTGVTRPVRGLDGCGVFKTADRLERASGAALAGGAGRGSRTPKGRSPADFESAAGCDGSQRALLRPSEVFVYRAA